jgi:two-component system cell cycle response regulator
MVLLGNLDLMKMNKDNPEQLAHYMHRIEQSGTRIADIVKKIQTIRYYETKPHLDKSSIINIDQKIALLSVEDSDNDYEMIRAIYDDFNQVELSRARNINEAIQILQQQQFDLILLDYIFPDGNGFDFLRRKAEEGIETPVVIITGQGDEMIASQFIKEGAYDYLTKDRLSEKSLSRSIMNALEKARLKRDVKEAQNKMAEMSTRDELTGVYNRRYFMEALEREVSKAKRYGNELVLCMLDLDHFKEVNDTYGHPAGDMVLREIGKMLKECVRQSDLICRYGGEEFAVILPSTQLEKARLVCERFRGIVKQHQFKYNSFQINITVSIGVTAFNHLIPESFNDLIAKADEALYRAKAEGRNRVVSNLGFIQ